jgi:hypothetical protein
MGYRRTISVGSRATRRLPPHRAGMAKAFERYLRGWPAIGVVLITFWSSCWTFNLVEEWSIRSTYGNAAWVGGLRVIDNKGHLSNGRELSGVQYQVVYFGSYLLSVPFFFGAVCGLSYLNMRLHGVRLRDYQVR